MNVLLALKSLKSIAIQSFYRKDLYINVARSWKGYGQKYLLILSLIMSLPTALYAANLLDDIYDILGQILKLHDKEIGNTDKFEAESARFIYDLLIQLPDFYIKNDKITANNDEKLIISSNVLKREIIMIDTKIGSKPNRDYIVNINNESISLGDVNLDLSPQIKGVNTIITQDIIFEYIRNFYKASISSYISLILAGTIYFVVAVYLKLIVNFLGMLILNKISNLGLDKCGVFRIVSISASPAIVMAGTINLIAFLSYFLFKINLMGHNFINIQNQLFSLLSLGYLFFAFISIRELRK